MLVQRLGLLDSSQDVDMPWRILNSAIGRTFMSNKEVMGS